MALHLCKVITLLICKYINKKNLHPDRLFVYRYKCVWDPSRVCATLDSHGEAWPINYYNAFSHVAPGTLDKNQWAFVVM